MLSVNIVFTNTGTPDLQVALSVMAHLGFIMEKKKKALLLSRHLQDTFSKMIIHDQN